MSTVYVLPNCLCQQCMCYLFMSIVYVLPNCLCQQCMCCTTVYVNSVCAYRQLYPLFMSTVLVFRKESHQKAMLSFPVDKKGFMKKGSRSEFRKFLELHCHTEKYIELETWDTIEETWKSLQSLSFLCFGEIKP